MSIATVIDTANKVPGSYIQVTLGVGPRSAGDAPRKVILYGNKTSAGAAVVAEAIQVLSEPDAITQAGQGSELHLGVKAALEVNRNVDLWIVPIAESAGVAANDDITFTSGPATEAGTVESWVNGTRVVAAIASGDAIADVATSVAAAINAQPDLPVTASAALGVVTVTAKHKGPRGNFIFLRTKLTNGAAIAHTAMATYLASGATSDDPQNAIDAVAPTRFHYHVAPYELAAEIAKFKTHVSADAEPEVGQRELFIYGSRDTLGNTTTLATGSNEARAQCVWKYNAETTPFEMACAMAAKRAREEGIDPGVNLDDETLPGLRIPVSSADEPLNSELVSALNNGITPLKTVNGVQHIVRSITTKSQDSGGNPDFGVLDTVKVVVPDFVADDLDANWGPRFAGTKATRIEDPPPPPGVISPLIVKDFIYERLKVHEAAGLLEGVDERKDEIAVELASSPAGRFNSTAPTDVIEGAHQLSCDLRQIG